MDHASINTHNQQRLIDCFIRLYALETRNIMETLIDGQTTISKLQLFVLSAVANEKAIVCTNLQNLQILPCRGHIRLNLQEYP